MHIDSSRNPEDWARELDPHPGDLVAVLESRWIPGVIGSGSLDHDIELIETERIFLCWSSDFSEFKVFKDDDSHGYAWRMNPQLLRVLSRADESLESLRGLS